MVADHDAPMAQAVTLTIKFDGTPQAGVKVYFQNPDSSLISNTVTDDTGVATALMPNGGYVSAVDAFGTAVPAGLPRRELHIFAGVKPGDHLNLSDQSNFGSQEVEITGAPDNDSSVVRYDMQSPCGRQSIVNQGSATSPIWTVSLDNPCATTDFLLTSIDDAGQVVHWAYAPNTAVGATLDFSSAGLSNAPTTKTYALDNADAFNGEMLVEQKLASPRGIVGEFGRLAFDPNSNLLLATSMDLPNFANAIDIVDTSATINFDAVHHLLDWGPFSTSYTVDVGARVLPDVSAPRIDTGLHQLTWTQAIGGAVPDFVTAWAIVQRSEPTNQMWQFWIAAPAGTAITMPTLPTDVADFNLQETDTVFIDNLNLGKVAGGYDAVRANIFDFALAVRDELPLTMLTTGASGSATLELWAPRSAIARTAPKGRRGARNQRVLTGRTH